jgi:arsenite-transporting ATPase
VGDSSLLSELIIPKKRGEPRFIFFSGKGGVGKSTMSCATAVWLAEKGYNTLLVTTDPAPNLSDIFGQEIGARVTSITGVANLSSIEIDPDVASDEYRERIIGPMRQLLDEKGLQVVREQLDSPCVEEVAAFDKFIEFMDYPKYDVVIFDTAPTGHTIRLLELPSGWSETLQKNASTCIGPGASLQSSKLKYERALASLQNPDKTLFVFVMKPEDLSLYETKRSVGELEKLSIKTHSLIVNGVLPKEACTDEFFSKKWEAQQGYVARIDEEFRDLEKSYYPLRDSEVIGIPKLESVAKLLFDGISEGNSVKADQSGFEPVFTGTEYADFSKLLIDSKGGTHYIFFTGKGGVGKSTVASTTALHLAEMGYRTLIVTTDPASHLQEIFEQPIDHEITEIQRVSNLYAARIDQRVALEEYKARILDAVKNFDDDTKKSILEDLNSPCAEEMSSFEKFISYFDETGFDVIVFDTAPTGHTLRLLELPSDWKGFIDLGSLTKSTSEGAHSKYTKVIETMRDRERSTFVFVMYPEYTPMVEAWRASEDLKKQVGIETALVAVNYLLPEQYGKNPFFESRRSQQERYVTAIRDRFKVPLMAVPLYETEPRGLTDLRKLGDMIFREGTKVEESVKEEMSDPVEKAKEFAKAIVDSDEYKKFVQCNKAIQENTSSKRLLAQYQSRQRRLKLGRFEPGLMDELKDLHDKVAADETIQSFNKSRAELTELLVATDDLISAKIGRRFAFTTGGSCCG